MIAALLALASTCALLLPGSAHALGARPLDGQGSITLPPGLPDVLSAVVSPDGVHVYAAAASRIAVYSWDAATTGLDGLQVISDGEGGADALQFPRAVAISPDGAHVYVASAGDDSVTVFSRDAGTGLLTFVEDQVDEVGGVDGLEGAFRVVVSSDGAHVYVLGGADEETAVFARDAGTGALTFVEAEPTLLTGLETFALSSDGGHLYVGSRFVASLRKFSRDPVTGALTAAGQALARVTEALVVSPDSGFVIIYDGDDIRTYVRDPVDGGLLDAGTGFVSGLTRGIAISPDGTRLVRALGSTVFAYDRDVVTGSLTSAGSTPTSSSFGATISPDGLTAFTTGGGLGVVTLDGLTNAPAFAGMHALDYFQRDIAISPDGEHMYIAGGTMLIALDRDPADGTTAPVEEYVQGLGGVDFVGAGHRVVVSPDGAHVYLVTGHMASFTANPPSLTAFSRDGGTGALTFIEGDVSGPGTPNATRHPQLVISPDGAHLYVTNHQGAFLSWFTRDLGTGEVTYGGSVPTTMEEPPWLLISPDGAFVYVADEYLGNPFQKKSTNVHIYARDPGSGALSLSSVANLPNVTMAAAMSPGGEHFYLGTRASFTSDQPRADRLLLHERDAVSGALSLDPIHEERGGTSGVIFGYPTHLSVGADGTHLYLAHFGPSSDPSGFASFVRDPETGATSFIESVPSEGRSVIPSPTDTAIYTVSGALLTRGFSCTAAPMAGCRTAEKGSIQIIDHGKDKSDRAKWTWKTGTPTTHAEFDPTGKHYAFCVYDDTGLLLASLIQADQTCGASQKPCWTDKVKRITFKDQDKTPEGASKVSLIPSDEKPQIKVKAQGEDLGWRVAAPLPPTLPVVVQLQGETGPCFAATYTAALKNDGTQFKSIPNLP